MAKSGRKRKKAEKSKTQLKTSMKSAGRADRKKKTKTASGIKLPKGLNETKIDLRTKELFVGGLTKLTNDVDQTHLQENKKRLRPITDILSKLKHPGPMHRLEALRALKTSFKEAPDSLHHHRSDVITRVMSLATDREEQIRELLAQVLELMFEKFPSRLFWSFDRLIIAHVCSGLSHVDPVIKRDSLVLLDQIVAHAPEIIAANHEQILPNCLGQITEKRRAGQGNGGRSEVALSAGISGRTTSTKWRLAVFQRLNSILGLVRDQKLEGGNEDKFDVVNSDEDVIFLTPEKTSDLGRISLLEQQTSIDGERVTKLWRGGLYDKGKLKASSNVEPTLKEFLETARAFSVRDGGMDVEKESFLFGFTKTLVPLLLQTWIELLPTSSGAKSKGRQIKSVGLSKESAEILLEVTSILLLLFRLLPSEAEQGSFRELFLDRFTTMSLLCFPLPSSFAEGPERLMQKLHLSVIQTYLTIAKWPEDGCSEKIWQYLKAKKLHKCPREEHEVVSEVLSVYTRILQEETFQRGGQVPKDMRDLGDLDDVALSLYECCRDSNEAALRLLLEMYAGSYNLSSLSSSVNTGFMCHLKATKAFISDLVPVLAQGRAGRFHWEAVEQMVKMEDHDAMEAFGARLGQCTEAFHENDWSVSYRSRTLRAVACYCHYAQDCKTLREIMRKTGEGSAEHRTIQDCDKNFIYGVLDMA